LERPIYLVPLGIQPINYFGMHSCSILSTSWTQLRLLFWIILLKWSVFSSFLITVFLIWSFGVYPATFLRNVIFAAFTSCHRFSVNVHVSELYAVNVGAVIVS
jgi:hypothetical protein